jgi:hypothetical protein
MDICFEEEGKVPIKLASLAWTYLDGFFYKAKSHKTIE